MPHPKVKISDNDGNTVAVDTSGGSNALKVALVAGTLIDIGDVDIHLSGHVPLLGGDGDVAPGVLRVTLASDDPAVASLDEIESAIEAIEAAVDGSYLNVNMNLAGSDAPTGAGTESGALRVTLANNSTGVITVDGEVTVTDLLADGHAVTIDNANNNEVFIAGGATQAANVKVSIENGGFDGAITAADNAIIILGAKADNKSDATDATAITMMQVLKQISASVQETATDTGTIDSDTNDIKTAVAIPTGMVSGVNAAVGTSVEDLVGSGSVAIKRIDLMADPSNTGYIWVGDASVVNDGTGGGIRLGAGDFYSMDIDDLNEVHVAATVADEDIMYTYYA